MTPEEYLKRAVERPASHLNRKVADCDEALRLDPDNPIAQAHRSYYRLMQSLPDGAIADFAEVIRRNPNEAYGYFLRGSAYYVQREWEPAIADLTEAIRCDPTYTLAYECRALVMDRKL